MAYTELENGLRRSILDRPEVKQALNRCLDLYHWLDVTSPLDELPMEAQSEYPTAVRATERLMAANYLALDALRKTIDAAACGLIMAALEKGGFLDLRDFQEALATVNAPAPIVTKLPSLPAAIRPRRARRRVAE